MEFKWYVLNYNYNTKKVEFYNIFNNIHVHEHAEKSIKKYLRNPKKFKRIVQYENPLLGREEIALFGWEAFVKEIDSIIAWQERGRCEYEIGVSDKFVTEIHEVVKDIDKLQFHSLDEYRDYLEGIAIRNPRIMAFDCYDQAHANINAICHEIIRQYKEQIKSK